MVNQIQVDIECISPRPVSLCESKALLPKDNPGISDVEDGTSENSRRLRREVEYNTPTRPLSHQRYQIHRKRRMKIEKRMTELKR